jgi:hypothetical protein
LTRHYQTFCSKQYNCSGICVRTNTPALANCLFVCAANFKEMAAFA